LEAPECFGMVNIASFTPTSIPQRTRTAITRIRMFHQGKQTENDGQSSKTNQRWSLPTIENRSIWLHCSRISQSSSTILAMTTALSSDCHTCCQKLVERKKCFGSERTGQDSWIATQHPSILAQRTKVDRPWLHQRSSFFIVLSLVLGAGYESLYLHDRLLLVCRPLPPSPWLSEPTDRHRCT